MTRALCTVMLAALLSSCESAQISAAPVLGTGEFVPIEQNYNVLSIPVANRIQIGTLVDLKAGRVLPMTLAGHLPKSALLVNKGGAADLNLVANRTLNGGISSLLDKHFRVYGSFLGADTSSLVAKNARAEILADIAPLSDFMLTEKYEGLSDSLRRTLERDGVEVVTEIISSSSSTLLSHQAASTGAGILIPGVFEISAGSTRATQLEARSMSLVPILFRTEKTGVPRTRCFDKPRLVRFADETSTSFDLTNHCEHPLKWHVNRGMTIRYKLIPSSYNLAAGETKNVILIRESCGVVTGRVGLNIDSEDIPHVFTVSQTMPCRQTASALPKAKDPAAANAAKLVSDARTSLREADFANAHRLAQAAANASPSLRDDPEFTLLIADTGSLAKDAPGMRAPELVALSNFAGFIESSERGEMPTRQLSDRDLELLKTNPAVNRAAGGMLSALYGRPAGSFVSLKMLLTGLGNVKKNP